MHNTLAGGSRDCESAVDVVQYARPDGNCQARAAEGKSIIRYRRGLRTDSCSQAFASSTTAIDAADDMRPFAPLPPDLESLEESDGGSVCSYRAFSSRA